MRAFVREDPDVILVGESSWARDGLEALRASQTAIWCHTLHCNDTVDAVQRWSTSDAPHSIASECWVCFRSAWRGGSASSVVPRRTTADLVQEVFPLGGPADMHFFKAVGCDHCRGTAATDALPLLSTCRLHGMRQGLPNGPRR